MKTKPNQKRSGGIHHGNSPKGALSRRSFFKFMGAGIATYVVFSDVFVSSAFSGDKKEFAFPDKDLLSSWIHISAKGEITVFTGKVEIGQNIRTSLSQVVAEELSVAPESITMIMGDTGRTPYDRGTYGSLTTLRISPVLRKAAANLRELLCEEANSVWKSESSSLLLRDGKVIDPESNNMLSFGELVQDKQLLRKVDENVKTMDPVKWKVAGQSTPKINGQDYITGTHRYVSDLVLPGMVYGRVLRPPSYGAKLLRADTSEAEKIPGVQVGRDGDFIGVTAENSWTAAIALASIESSWEKVPQIPQDQLFKHLINAAEKKETTNEKISEAYNSGDIKLSRRFEIDYIAHVPLETRSALALWTEDSLEVWAGTQRPFGLHEDLQKTFDLPEEKVRVYVPDTGSGYGGKQTSEAGIETARLSKLVGKPVKICWTREEEFKWAYFRPAGVIEVKASAKEGHMNSWEFHNYNSGAAGIDLPYSGVRKQVEFHRSASPLRQGSYRALASTANIFAMESVVNDLAVDSGIDPLRFRLEHLENPRLIAAIEAASDAFGWNRPKNQDNIGYGMACGTVKGGFVATFAEVEIERETRKLVVRRVVSAFECGVIINPRHLESQVAGCILQGLGGALFETVTFKEDNITNSSLSSYRVPRFKDIPDLKVVLLDRKDLPSSGAGEASIVCIAPALRNAIQDASGVRLFRLPMLPSGIVPENILQPGL